MRRLQQIKLGKEKNGTKLRKLSQCHFFGLSIRYRKVVLNNCTKGVKEMYTARKQQCPNRPPKGLLLTTKDGKLTANLGSNVTFLVHLDEVRARPTLSTTASLI